MNGRAARVGALIGVVAALVVAGCGSPDLDRDGDGALTCDEVRAYGLAPFGPREPDDSHCAPVARSGE